MIPKKRNGLDLDALHNVLNADIAEGDTSQDHN